MLEAHEHLKTLNLADESNQDHQEYVGNIHGWNLGLELEFSWMEFSWLEFSNMCQIGPHFATWTIVVGSLSRVPGHKYDKACNRFLIPYLKLSVLQIFC